MRERVAAKGDASRDPTLSIFRATSATTATAVATMMANDDGNDNGNGDGGGDGGNKERSAVMIFPLPSRCHRMFR
jgi:Spy/CpxP family protein refolding chaperone